jgi:hypothetical protein
VLVTGMVSMLVFRIVFVVPDHRERAAGDADEPITDVGQTALPPDRHENGKRKSGAARRKRAEAAHAFITNSSTAMQGIALDAAEGDETARGQLLRMLHDMHEVLQPTPDEAKSGGGPILPKFTRPDRSTKQAEPAPAVELPGVVYDREGKPYVEAE